MKNESRMNALFILYTTNNQTMRNDISSSNIHTLLYNRWVFL